MEVPVALIGLNSNYAVLDVNEWFRGAFTSCKITGLNFVNDLIKKEYRQDVETFLDECTSSYPSSHIKLDCAITFPTNKHAFPRSFNVYMSGKRSMDKAYITIALICSKAYSIPSSEELASTLKRNVGIDIEDIVDYIEEAPIALHLLSASGHVLWSNKTHRDLLGYSAEEMTGKHLSDFSTAMPETIKEGMQMLIDGGVLVDKPAKWIAKDGAIRHVLLDSNSHFDEKGEFKNTRCFIRDDTATHIQNARNSIMNQADREKKVAQDQFLRRVLHEVRTPCNIMMQLLENNGDNDDISSDAMKTLLSQTYKLSDMIKDVEDAAIFESGKTIQQRMTAFSIMDAIQSAFSNMMEDAGHVNEHVKKTIVFNSKIANSILPKTVKMDRRCLLRVIRHLLSNALRLTNQGSIQFEIDVDCTPLDSRCCAITFRISNTGPRIEESFVHMLFHNYWAMDDTTEINDSTLAPHDAVFFDFNIDLGIEMNICYNIVLAMGSELKFSNFDGKNSFWFTIEPPVNDWMEYRDFMNKDEYEIESERSERATSFANNWIEVIETDLYKRHIVDVNEPISRESNSLTGCTLGQSLPRRPHVLVVDDNAICQKVLCLTLQKLDSTSEVASNGQIACDLVQHGLFDIIFLDLRMPCMSGLEACRTMRNELEITIPIIAFSAESSPVIQAECIATGMTDFIQKPAKQKQIKAVLEIYCKL